MDIKLLGQILLTVFIPFIFVVMIMPYIKKVAVKINAMDIPRERRIHQKITPKLGGVGILFGFFLGYMLFGEPSTIMNAILIASFIIILVGIVDDISDLSALPQFLSQLIAAAIIVFYGGLLLKDISAFGIVIHFGIFAYPLTLFFIVGCMNCINLIDGMDGLSSGISAIYFLTIGIIATIQGKFGLDFVLSFVMLGSVLGFFVYNFNPASIFVGDGGANFLGFMISVVALLGFKNVTMTSLIIPLLVLAIPILDTLFAIIRRSLKGEKIFQGDKFHIHHQLLNRNLSQKQTVLIILGIDVLFATASIIYVLKDRILGYIIYGVLLTIVILFVIKTNVVFELNEQTKLNLKVKKSKKTLKK